MAKSEVVTLRISTEVRKELEKVFGADTTTSDMIRQSIDSYLEKIKRAEKGIVSMDLPVNLLKGDDLKELFECVSKLEQRTTQEVIKKGFDYDLEYLKAIQDSKNLLVSHMSIDNAACKNKKDIEKLKKTISDK